MFVLKQLFKIKIGFIVGVILFSLTSCSAIMNGSTQDVRIKASESKATIYVDGMKRGITPKVVRLQRGTPHLIEIKKDGFDTYQITTHNSIAGAFWGNLLCGGVIGIVIDLATGSAYDIEPNFISADLFKSTVMLHKYDSDKFTQIFIKDNSGNITDSFVIEWE